MHISWLEDFLVLAAVGNFSRAAEDRHMTQPAFGRRVRALEEWLGSGFKGWRPICSQKWRDCQVQRAQWWSRIPRACDLPQHMLCR